MVVAVPSPWLQSELAQHWSSEVLSHYTVTTQTLKIEVRIHKRMQIKKVLQSGVTNAVGVWIKKQPQIPYVLKDDLLILPPPPNIEITAMLAVHTQLVCLFHWLLWTTYVNAPGRVLVSQVSSFCSLCFYPLTTVHSWAKIFKVAQFNIFTFNQLLFVLRSFCLSQGHENLKAMMMFKHYVFLCMLWDSGKVLIISGLSIIVLLIEKNIISPITCNANFVINEITRYLSFSGWLFMLVLHCPVLIDCVGLTFKKLYSNSERLSYFFLFNVSFWLFDSFHFSIN